MDKVDTLLLGGNQINHIEDGFFLTFPNIRIIDLTQNSLHALYRSNSIMDKVEALQLSGNSINQIEDGFFLSFPSVREL